MTATQHNAQPTDNQPEAAIATSRKSAGGVPEEKRAPSGSLSAKGLQRSWMIALGLLSGSGFVASQMSFALAESDFLVDDYAATPSLDAASLGVANTTFTYSESTFTPDPLPSPVQYVPAPTPAPQPRAAALRAAEPEWVADYQSAPPASVAAAPVAAAPAPAIETKIAPAVTSNRPAAARTATNQPTVSEVAPPTFSSVRKPKKVLAKAPRSGSLASLAEAGAATVPHGYAAGSLALAPSMVQMSAMAQANSLQARQNGSVATPETTTVVAMEGGSVEMEISPAPAVLESIPAPTAAPPIVEIAPAAPIQPTELVPAALPEGTNLPDEYNSVFVDPTDYSVGATEAPSGVAAGAPEIVVSEQSTGCEFTVGGGRGVPNGACAAPSAAPAPIAAGQPAGQNRNAPAAAPYAAQDYYEAPAPVASGPAVTVGPVSFSAEGIRFSGTTTAAGREYLNRTVRPLVNLQASEQFIFPLAVPSPITSLFGFRTHPISGDRRFHAGTDIGAAQGTPVLASQDGKVSSAGYAGGYGLMVVLNHQTKEAQLESRYAHLAEILVEPNAEVKKGDVIGLVGSTGNSTGPHLHFEMRQLTADGWVLVNPDGLVQQSLANLVKALNNPMQALNFNMSDFDLRLANGATKAEPSTAVEATVPGLNGIPFRPAQPNAS